MVASKRLYRQHNEDILLYHVVSAGWSTYVFWLEEELLVPCSILDIPCLWLCVRTHEAGLWIDLVLLHELDEHHCRVWTAVEAGGHLRCVARVRRLYGHGKRREWTRIPPSQRVSRLQLLLLSSCVSCTLGIALFNVVPCPRATCASRILTPSPCEARYAWLPTPASTASLRREWSFAQSPSCCHTNRRSRCPLRD